MAIQDEKWGESPCAFMEIGPENKLTEQDALNWCKEKLASFKVPKKFIFESIPRTSTGKIQKYILRKRAELIFSSKQ